MDVQGKVRWRIDQNAPWTEAKVNDLLSAGAEIRTGLKSRSTLRVGKNATILVDSGTTFQLPEMVQEGQTLRTLATVKSGRADFKVDHVGFANDFKVVTPQTTLSVRGTGFALASGPLKGVDISGANSNTINAIEVKYIAANIAYFVSGQGKTSSESGRQDPVQNAWVSTIGPPPIAGTMVSQSDVQQQVAQGMAGANPSSNIQQIQQTQAGQSNENAIDTALILASDSGGGGTDSNVYLRFQQDGVASTIASSVLKSKNQNNLRESSAQLENFNGNFNVYESGDWQKSLLGLNRLWYARDDEGATNSFSSTEIGVGRQLQIIQSIAFNDLT
ncbi:MAG: FecR domain-containing protein, partial [Phycisphaerae bacterium]